MRFLVDECAGPVLAQWLRDRQHDVFSVYEQARGMDDDLILEKAQLENRILVTSDKDFGEKVYRERRPHNGVILLRLRDERNTIKINAVRTLLDNHAGTLQGQFIVVSETRVRVARNGADS